MLNVVTCKDCGASIAAYANGKRCRECYNAYMRVYVLARYHKRKAAFTAEMGGLCTRCGGDDRLEFDHIDPATKRYDVGHIWSMSDAKVRAELALCHLLCHGCHAAKSWSEMAAKVFTCCGREFVGLSRYRGHRRWCTGR